MSQRSTGWGIAGAAALTVAILFTSPGRALAHRFRVALRIATPQRVTVNAPSFGGANRRLLEAVGGMIGKTVDAMVDEPDAPVANVAAAEKLAGFAAQLPRARTDAVTLSVIGAHEIQMTASRANLRTMLTEAGRPQTPVPASLEGAVVTMKVPRAIRAQYGNCPLPPPATIQGQLQSPPPVTADNGSCVVLTESPNVSAQLPDSLDVRPLVEIALELAGMSPNQTSVLQGTMDWKSLLALSMPRGVRSYDSVMVGSTRGMLVSTVARRGPTYALVWAHDGFVFTLTGYGSPAEAVPLANSVR